MEPILYDYNAQGIRALKEAFEKQNGYDVTFLLQKNGQYDFESIEKNLKIGPVAVLQQANHTRYYGVYAKETINANQCLGEYLGDRLTEAEIAQLEKHGKYNPIYSFECPNGEEINATSRRGWPAIVNAASCAAVANVCTFGVDGHVYYKSTRTIHAGEQLLVDYGEEYHYEGKHFFLNPNNNWQDSRDIYLNPAHVYEHDERPLDSELINLLDIKDKKRTRFMIPDISRTNRNSVDIPILACLIDPKLDPQLLPQHQQDNLTLLHLACWQGNAEQVTHLLKYNANPRQQTTQQGFTTLHFIILSPHTIPDKKIILIDLIQAASKYTWTIPDYQDRSILNIAREKKYYKLITYLEANKCPEMAPSSRHSKSTKKRISHAETPASDIRDANINSSTQVMMALTANPTSLELTPEPAPANKSQDIVVGTAATPSLDALKTMLKEYSIWDLVNITRKGTPSPLLDSADDSLKKLTLSELSILFFVNEFPDHMFFRQGYYLEILIKKQWFIDKLNAAIRNKSIRTDFWRKLNPEVKDQFNRVAPILALHIQVSLYNTASVVHAEHPYKKKDKPEQDDEQPTKLHRRTI